MSWYQKSKTNLDFAETRMAVASAGPYASLHLTPDHASTPPLSFLQAGCPSCRPTKSVKALKAQYTGSSIYQNLGTASRKKYPLKLNTALKVKSQKNLKSTASQQRMPR